MSSQPPNIKQIWITSLSLDLHLQHFTGSTGYQKNEYVYSGYTCSTDISYQRRVLHLTHVNIQPRHVVDM